MLDCQSLELLPREQKKMHSKLLITRQNKTLTNGNTLSKDINDMNECDIISQKVEMAPL